MTAHEFEPVIGLEVHAQLLTRSKMFCGCSASYNDAPPNTHVCAVCGGMPGALPVINRKAVDYTITVGLALHCAIAENSKFDRKNYSYPDLPKGYQISQYDLPLARNGWVEYAVEGKDERCGITRVHLEEDTGKSTHTTVDGRDVSLIDYNRSGVPLLEIVSEPDIRSARAARVYFETLRRTLMYLGVNDGNLQEGSMRADVNISLRRPGSPLGPGKVEVKNLNSFQAVERAIEYEIERQARILANGDSVEQETRGWSEAREVTLPQRSKEYAADYRYFPEPDLPPLAVSSASVQTLAASLPELAAARADRFVREYAITPALAEVLTDERARAEYFEAVVQADGVPPAMAANWVSGEVLALLKEQRIPIAGSPVPPQRLSRLLELIATGRISNSAGKTVFQEMFATGEEPDAIVERLDLAQIGDEQALQRIVDQVLAENPSIVDTIRRGKTNAVQALFGKVMGASKGKANPAKVREILDRSLAELV